ncbi:hypothetical protein M3197_10920 [Sporosarcina aquimarina]|uniref:AAA family ATPase n=1 Tax=Sporosarcina aquimarina TaxID=114975 RepID=UPI00203AA0CF|nr:AAA family ATPase [Sporosarcina aquimarina]MCM3757978.1 hypothetical protein [Sporosarcina aquimarina]
MFLNKITLLHEKRISFLHTDCADLELTNPITYFVGENRSGKSTLLEGIADYPGASVLSFEEGAIHSIDYKRTHHH